MDPYNQTPIRLNDVDVVDEGNRFGYWTDITGLECNELNQSWIQAMPLGTYVHPVHGPIIVSKDRVKQFADNVNAGVRGQELDIDYDHKAKTTEAAGWVKEARCNFRDTDPKARGLWLLVEWTAEAADKIRSKAYRYFSPEFIDKWTHPATQKQFNDVLLGGALTNRPFLKGILPINLSEMTSIPTEETQGENDVDRELLEAIATSLSVKFEASVSDADLQALISVAAQAANEGTDGNDDSDASDGDTTDSADNTEQPVAANENDLVQLAETNPAIKALIERVNKMEVASRLADVNVRLSELNTTDQTLVPAVQKKVANLLASAPENVSTQLFEVIKDFVDGKAVVKLGEVGVSGSGFQRQADNSDSAGSQFNDLVVKLTEGESPMAYADAVEKVSVDHPDLFDRYRAESFSGGMA